MKARGGRFTAIGWLCSLVGLGVACNLVTGADGIEFVGAGGSGSGTGNTPSTASAPTTDAASTSGTDAAGTSGGQTVASSGSGNMVASSSSSGSTCMYPAGPFGNTAGKILQPTLKWSGYPAGSTQPGSLAIQDLFDCDGTKGITAIVFDTSQWG